MSLQTKKDELLLDNSFKNPLDKKDSISKYFSG